MPKVFPFAFWYLLISFYSKRSESTNTITNTLDLLIASPIPTSMVAGSTFSSASASSASSSSSFSFLELHAIRVDAFGRRSIDETIDGNEAWARVSAIVADDEIIDSYASFSGESHTSEDEVLKEDRRRFIEESKQLIDQEAASFSHFSSQIVRLSGKESLLTRFSRGKAIWNVSSTTLDVLPGRYVRLIFSLGVGRSGATVGGGGSSLPISVIKNTPPVLSQPILVGRGIPARLAVVVGPGSSTGGVPFSTQPMVVVVDEAGNECTPKQVPQDVLSPDVLTPGYISSANPCSGAESYEGLGVMVSVVATPSSSVINKGDKNDSSVLLSKEDPIYQFITNSSTNTTLNYYAPFINGRAIFKSLLMNQAGYGYILRFTAVIIPEKNSTISSPSPSSSSSPPPRPRRRPWAALNKLTDITPSPTPIPKIPLSPRLMALATNKTFVDSNLLTIGVGPPVSLRVSQDIEVSARASDPFVDQPVVELLDAGGNVCTHALGYSVSVAIEVNPGRLSFSPTRTNYQRGVLSPLNLYKAYPRSKITVTVHKNAEYALVSADPSSLANDELDAITNGDEIGFLSESDTPSFLSNQSPSPQSWAVIRHVPFGEFRLRLQTPWQGETMTDATIIKRQIALRQKVINGKATFERLSIDKIGIGYVLRFTVDPPFASSTSSSTLQNFVLSKAFNVIHNTPSQLVIIREASDAWAGNHPFAIQPVVAVADAGGNILLNRGDDVVTVSLVKEGCSIHAQLLGQRRVRIEDGVAEFSDLSIDQPTCEDEAFRALSPSYNASSLYFSLLFSANVRGYGHMNVYQHGLRVMHSADALIKPFLSSSTSIEVANTALSLGAAVLQSSIANGRGWTVPKRRAAQIASGGGALADRFGHAIAVGDDLLVSSSIYSDSPKRNTQILRLLLDDVGATTSYLNGVDAGDKTAPPPAGERPTDSLGFVSAPEVISLTISAEWKPAIQIVAIKKTGQSQLLSGGQGGFFTLALVLGDSPTQIAVTRSIPARADEDLIKAVLEADIMRPLGLGPPPQEDDDGSSDAVFVTRLTQDELEESNFKIAWRITFVGLKDESLSLPLLTVNSAMLADASCNVTVIEVTKASYLGGTFKLVLPRSRSPLAIVRDAYHASSQGPPLIYQNTTPATGAYATTRELAFNISAQDLARAITEDLFVGPVSVIASITEPFEPYGPNTPHILPSRLWRIEFSDRNDLSIEGTSGGSSNDIPTLQPDARGLRGHNANALVHVVRAAVSPPSGSFRLSYKGVVTPPLNWNATSLELRTALINTRLVLDADVKVVSKPVSKSPGAVSGSGSTNNMAWERASMDAMLSDGATLVREWEVTILQVADIPDGTAKDDGGGIIEPVGSPLVWVSKGDDLVGGTLAEEVDAQVYSSWTPGGTPPEVGVLIGSVNGKRPRIEIYSGNVPGDGVLGSGPGKRKSSNGDKIERGGAGSHTGRVYLSRRLHRNSWMPLQQLVASDGDEHDLFGHSLALSSAVYSEQDEAKQYIEDGYSASIGVIAVGAPGAKRRPESFTPSVVDESSSNSFFPFNTSTSVPDVERREFPSGPFGDNVTGLASGAVYVFEPANAWAGITDGQWWQSARVQAPRSALSSSSSCSHLLFGWSVALTVSSSSRDRHSLIIGSPGDCDDGGEEAGAVYVYNRPAVFNFLGPKDISSMEEAKSNDERTGMLTSNSWGVPVQKLLATTHNSGGGKGLRFGWSVALSSEGDTLAVGAPGDGNGRGAVFIFKRQPEANALFFIDQVLRPNAQHSTQAGSSLAGLSGAALGYSVAFGGDVLVAGAPGARALIGSVIAGEATGCGYIYDRRGWGSLSFGGQVYLRSIACPDVTREGDRVGISVAASSHAIILGSSSRFEGDSHLIDENSGASSNEEKDSFISGRVFAGVATGEGEKFSPPRPQKMSQSAEFAFPSAPGGGSTNPGQSFIVPSPVKEVQVIRILFPANFSSSFTVNDQDLSLWGSFKLQWKRRPFKFVTKELWADLSLSKRLSGVYKRASLQRVFQETISPSSWQVITGRRLPWNASPRMVRRSLEGDLGTGRVRVSRSGPGTAGAYSWSVTFLNPPSLVDTEVGTSSNMNIYQDTGPLPLLRASNLLTLVANAPSRSIGFDGSQVDAVDALLSPHSRVVDLDDNDKISITAPYLIKEGSSNRERYPLKMLCKPAEGLKNVNNHTQVEDFRSFRLFNEEDCTRIPQPTISITRLTAPSLPIRGAAYIYTRNPNVPPLDDPEKGSGIGGTFGFGSEWSPTAVLSPYSHQRSDLFGSSVALSPSGAIGAVGSPGRDVSDEQGGSTGLTSGAVFAYEMSFLNYALLNSTRTDAPFASIATISEGSTYGPHDVVSRNLHSGIGLASLHNLEVTVCGRRKIPSDPVISQSSCVVPFIADEDSPALLQSSGSLTQKSSEGHGTDRPAIVYASTVNGNDLGDFSTQYSSSTSSSFSSSNTLSYSNEILTRAREFPAISSASRAYLGRPQLTESAQSASDCFAGHSAGTGECHFRNDGVFDFKGEQDFAPTTVLLASLPVIDMNQGGSAIADSIAVAKNQIHPSVPVVVHDDDVVESPDEIFHAKLWLPGMQPLFGGPLWAAISIADDGDGGIGSSDYISIIRNPATFNSSSIDNAAAADIGMSSSSRSSDNEDKDSFFGGSVAIDQSGHHLAVIGSPGEKSGKGAARVLKNSLGVWGEAAGEECALNGGPRFDSTSARFGTAVAIYSSLSTTWVAVSAPGVPAVAVFKHFPNGSNCSTSWTLQAILLPEFNGAEKLGATQTSRCFGSREYTKSGSSSSPFSAFYATKATEFRPNGLVLTASDRFGGRGALAMMSDGANGVIVAVGCVGAEAVFIYRSAGLDINEFRNPQDNSKITLGTASSSTWSLTRVLRSSEFKEVINPVVSHPLLFGFGSAVAASGTMLVVGAPQAVPPSAPIALNDPRFNQTRQSFLTNYVETYGTGAVFVFYLVGGLQLSDIGADLKYPEKTTWEALANWPAADAATMSAERYFTSASVLVNGTNLLPSSFLLACDDLGGDALWVQHSTIVKSNARPGDRFGASVAADGGTIVVGAWGVGTSHTPRARRRSVLNSTGYEEGEEEDDDYAVTWDFETGDLRGWTASGNAFMYQPVVFDNAAYRPAYAASTTGQNALFGTSFSSPSSSSSSLPLRESAARAGGGGRGRYWIGTYDARPADLAREKDIPVTARSAKDFVNISLTDDGTKEGMVRLGGRDTWRGTSGWRPPFPNTDPVHGTAGTSSTTRPGTAQGDYPTGSLTSQQFYIAGAAISFLIGGGCDSRFVYIELVVDGRSVRKATGGCRDEMSTVVWDTLNYVGLVAFIRIVDGSQQSPWGHINVDEIVFSWDTAGFTQLVNAGKAMVYRRVVAAPKSYPSLPLFDTSSEPSIRKTVPQVVDPPIYPPIARNSLSRLVPCPSSSSSSLLTCIWQLEAELSPPISRSGTRFGSSVAVSESSGVILVGATNALSLSSSYFEQIEREGEDLGPSLYNEGRLIRRQARKREAEIAAEEANLPLFGVGEAVFGGFPTREEIEMTHELGGTNSGMIDSNAEVEMNLKSDEMSIYDKARITPLNFPGGKSITGGLSDLGLPIAFRMRQNEQFKEALQFIKGSSSSSSSSLFSFSSNLMNSPEESAQQLLQESGDVPQPGSSFTRASADRNGQRGGAVFAFISEPDKVGGGGGGEGGPVLVAPRVWPSEGQLIELPGGFSSPSSSSTSNNNGVSGLGEAVALGKFVGLLGAPLSGGGIARRGGGSVAIVDLRVGYASFDSHDFTDPAKQLENGGEGTPKGFFRSAPRVQRIKVSSSGQVIYHPPVVTFPKKQIIEKTKIKKHHKEEEEEDFSSSPSRFAEGFTNYPSQVDAIIPVFRYGMSKSFPVSSPATLQAKSGPLHVHYTTRDITAVSVSQTVAAKCSLLSKEVRQKCFCGDYVREAGRLVFDSTAGSSSPSSSSTSFRNDIIVSVIRNSCSEGGRGGNLTRSFAVDLFVPGGARLRSDFFSITVRIEHEVDEAERLSGIECVPCMI